MTDYGIWTIITPLVTIILAIWTRQVILSLLAGVFVGFTVMNDFNPIVGVKDTLDGIINIFGSAGSTRTILFCFMVGGLIRLIQVTGGTKALVRYLTEKANIINSKKAVQLLAMFITSLIFIESSISIMAAGTSTNELAKRYGVSREKMAYVIQASCVSVCSSIMINGWGAAMMGVIGVQVTKGFVDGEPFSILAGSMVYNFMAWLSLASVLFYVLSGFKWGSMGESEERAATGKELRDGAFPITSEEEVEVSESAQGKESILNFLVPLVPTILMVPVGLFITGDGNIANGSGSTSVFWGVMFGTACSLVYFVGLKLLDIESFFQHLFKGYATMIPLGAIMTLAFLMGNVSGDLNTGAYITNAIDGIIPSGFSAAFVFLIAVIMAISTGTSWGTFSIMIPIGIQIGASVGIDPQLMIGAAISGAIFGDMTSPISDTGIVASMATKNDHIDHIRTQFPYAIATGFVATVLFTICGFSMLG
ncbi:Na+/H+ antiporter NhaC family protein [Vibrio sp. SA48]|uniref:Na+/H+ antiporter NhaC family protein n=1 Tax=Vibrio sp. S12_S33 TaxID=2720223 RepID=UPI0017860D82|nr:Na+/H+ antiporter NhaC family protein [Vibrio sp. S12_S33]MBD1567275.1 sodium:proton antiporter [Vibrio sp. S12_S33]